MASSVENRSLGIQLCTRYPAYHLHFSRNSDPCHGQQSKPMYLPSTVSPGLRIFVSRSAFRWDNNPFKTLVSMMLMP